MQWCIPCTFLGWIIRNWANWGNWKKNLAWFIILEIISQNLSIHCCNTETGLSTIKLVIVTHTFGLQNYIKWQEYHCTKRAGSCWELGDKKYRTESWEKMPLRTARKDAFSPVCNEDWHDIWGNKKWQHEVLHIFILFSACNIIPMTFAILCLQSKVKHVWAHGGEELGTSGCADSGSRL